MIASTPVMTVVGGLIGALLFLFLLTAVGNLEKCLFGGSFASKWAEVCMYKSMIPWHEKAILSKLIYNLTSS